MKALVLCAGAGTRLRPLTHSRAKALLPVAGRPVLLHILAQLRQAGIHSVGLVISPRQEDVRALVGDGEGLGLSVRYFVQPTPGGIADAVRRGRRWVGPEPFLVYLGDNLCDLDLAPLLARSTEADAVLTVKEVADPSAFGVALLEGERVMAVVEKPARPPSRHAIVGLYLFSPAVFDAIDSLRPSARGELEITDAIAALIAAGRTVLAVPLTGYWFDMGSVQGVLEANVTLLDRLEPAVADSAHVSGSRLQGRIRLEASCQVVDSVLRGPLIIGAGSTVSGCFIGPYTAVGAGVRLTGCRVENSILLDGCSLSHVPFPLSDCLVGSQALVAGEDPTGHAGTLILGDDSRVHLPGGRTR